jgi:hypothetical protein
MRKRRRQNKSEAGRCPASRSETGLIRKKALEPSFDDRSGDLAAAFALATVLAFATHVAGIAAALALATVEAFAVMFVRGGARGRRACVILGA